jgi:hypothetical protein
LFRSMDSEEREIYHFLKQRKDEFTAAREICRRAGGKEFFRRNPQWAMPVLLRMVDRGILETDSGGHFRVKPPKKNDRMQRWVSPAIAEALRNKGEKFKNVIMSDLEMDDYYDKL